MIVDEERQIFLNVGLNNGVLLKTVIDSVTGNLTDTRTRFLGSKPVKLFKITVNKQDALLALSSRPWVFYNFQGNQIMVPLSYETMDFASAFCSSECLEGIVGISGHTLRIISPERLGEVSE
jgi:splicing factor 3B subunit 3